MRELWELKQMQSLPLAAKVRMTENRIREWVTEYGEDGVYVSFSGGKDSTVLLDIVRRMYPGVEAVFVNTGLEYPEIQQFVKTFDNVKILRPKMRFDEVLRTYGYPLISKQVALAIYYAKKGSVWAKNNLSGIDEKGNPHKYRKGMYGKYKPICNADFAVSDKCCRIMKEQPLYEYGKRTQKKPIIAIMAAESKRRQNAWLQTGCNAFEGKNL